MLAVPDKAMAKVIIPVPVESKLSIHTRYLGT